MQLEGLGGFPHPPGMSLNPTEVRRLIQLAREGVRAAALLRTLPPLDPSAEAEPLRQLRASFVSLYREGILRGCIGTFTPAHPLAEEIRWHAMEAASRDYRFPPVEPGELHAIRVELSILTPPRPLRYQRADEILARLRPGVDGVILEKGARRATFLPQVWTKVPEAAMFLEMLCTKAGFAPQAWLVGDMNVYTYQAEVLLE
jgi:AmmeMemoRadiSam system protein A